MVGSDHQAHYLFIGSSRHGDLTVVTTQRGGERAVSPHTDETVSQDCWGAMHRSSKLWWGRDQRVCNGLLQENGAAPVGIFMGEVTQRRAVSPAMSGVICANTNKGED